MKLTDIICEKNIQLFHGGGEILDKQFKLEYRTGEGSRVLGPGIYFGNNVNTAKRFVKYAPDKRSASLTTAVISDDNVYAYIGKEVYAAAEQIAIKLGYDSYDALDSDSANKYYSTMTTGPAAKIGKVAGPSEGRRLLIAHGIDGVFENVYDDRVEYCIFNLDIIKRVKKIPLSNDDFQRHVADAKDYQTSLRNANYMDQNKGVVDIVAPYVRNSVFRYYDANQHYSDNVADYVTPRAVNLAKKTIIKDIVNDVRKSGDLPSGVSQRTVMGVLDRLLTSYLTKKQITSSVIGHRGYGRNDAIEVLDSLVDWPDYKMVRNQLKNLVDKHPKRLASYLYKQAGWEFNNIGAGLADEINDAVKKYLNTTTD